MFHQIGKIFGFQSADFESTGDFVFQQFFHLRITVDFIIAHGNKVIHQRVPYLIQKLTECQKYRFFDVLQIDFVLCDHELESQKETVINLIVAYHGYKGFGLVVYLLDCYLTEFSSDQLL